MKQLVKIYLSAIKNTYYSLVRSWIIIPFSAILLFISNIIINLLVQIGPSGGFSVGGFLAGMFSIFALNIFYKWIQIVTSGNKLRLQDIKELDCSFFSQILNVAFILFIINLLAGALFVANKSFLIILNFIIVFLCNPVPECIILKNYYGSETLIQSFKFIKSYYIEWFLPYIIFLLPLVIVNFNQVLLLLGMNDVLIPGNTFNKGATVVLNLIGIHNYFVIIPIAFIIALFFSIFRVYLFDALDGKIRK